MEMQSDALTVHFFGPFLDAKSWSRYERDE